MKNINYFSLLMLVAVGNAFGVADQNEGDFGYGVDIRNLQEASVKLHSLMEKDLIEKQETVQEALEGIFRVGIHEYFKLAALKDSSEALHQRKKSQIQEVESFLNVINAVYAAKIRDACPDVANCLHILNNSSQVFSEEIRVAFTRSIVQGLVKCLQEESAKQ